MDSDLIMTHVKKSAILLAVLVINQVMVPYIDILGVTPNLLFEAIMILSLIEEKPSNIVYAVVFGSIYDVLNGKIFGVFTILFLTISFIVSELYHNYFEDMTAMQILLLVLSNLLYGTLIGIFFAFLGTKFIMLFSRITLVEFVYNSIFGIIMILVVKKHSNKNKRRFFR